MRIALLISVNLLILNSLVAQVDTSKIHSGLDYTLGEIEVKAERTPMRFSSVSRQLDIISRKEIEAAGYSSIGQVIRLSGSLDQRRRGPLGIQSDISINGGTYEQLMVMLNGVNISDPQTGHFHMDIPVPISAIERIEIISGSASRVLGPNAFSGAINIVTRTDTLPALMVNGELGQFNYRNADFYAGTRLGKFTLGLSSQYGSTSGYRENTDSKNGSAFLRSGINIKKHTLSWSLGANKKAFGANSFYSPSFPDQYEETGSLFSSLSWGRVGILNWNHDLYARYHEDEFHLFRYESPWWYSGPNNHLTRVLGSHHNFWFDNRLGRTSAGAEVRTEKIWSNILGDPLRDEEYRIAKKTDTLDFGGYRNHFSFYAEHRWSGQKLNISGGLLVNLIAGNEGGVYYFPGIDLSYRLMPDLKIYSGINKSLRLPSFTEMYYSSPTHSGNPGLLPETAWDYRLGIRMARNSQVINALVNPRWSENSIDWSRDDPGEKWVSRNVRDIFTVNFDINYQISGFLPGSSLISIGYHYILQQKDETSLDSRYLMDYLKHKISLQAGIGFLKAGRITLDLYWADRAGEYTDWDEMGLPFQKPYDPFLTVDIRLKWGVGRTSFKAGVSNLFNAEYADIGHIWQPGRWMTAGVQYDLSGQ